MAGFNLTAEINLRGPSNLKKVVGDIKRQLSGIQASVDFKVSEKAAKNLNAITNSINTLNNALLTAQTSANSLTSVLSSVGGVSSNTAKSLSSAAQGVEQIVSSTTSASKVVSQATSEMAEFGKQSALAVRRFAAFSVATGAIYGLGRAFTSAYSEFIQFDREIIRLKQTVGGFGTDIDSISDEVTRLSTTFGVSSSDLIKVAVTLAQAGLTARETKTALEALAKTTLSPSFEDITQTTEGAIAALRQFGLGTKDLEASLGSINAVAAAFAVESGDIIAAIQRTGGVFATASRGVSQGKDALNEFIAVFTSVRATTRESAETIATGLRTIFTRIQRGSTIQALREYGIELTDLQGKFVGSYEAVRRLSVGLSQLNPRDIRFSKIVEELGGFRQIGKVIPLIQEFSTAQEALAVAQQGQSSLATNAIQAQQALAVQFSKTRQEFLAFVRALGESDTFKNIISYGLSLTRVMIQVAASFKPILPYLAILGGLKGGAALTEYVGGFFGGLKKGAGQKNTAPQEDLLSSLFGSAKEKSTADSTTTGRLESLLSENSTALANVNNSLIALNRTLSSKSGGGGPSMGFATGGYVPGSGNRDTVPAMLTPGEFVIRKKAVETIGANNLQRMNRYASGGRVTKKLGALQPPLSLSETVSDIDSASSNIVLKPIDLTDADLETMSELIKKQKKTNKQILETYGSSGTKQTEAQKSLSGRRKSPNTVESFVSFKENSEWLMGNAFQQLLEQKYPVKSIQPKGFGTSTESFDDIIAEHFAPLDFETGDAKFVKDIQRVKNEELLSKRIRDSYNRNLLVPSPTLAEDDFELPDTDVYYPKPGLKDKFYSKYIATVAELAKKFPGYNLGGLVQKFMPGGQVESLSGVESTLLSKFDIEKLEPTNSDDVEELIALIELMGGNEKTRNLANIQSMRIGDRNVRSGDILSANKLRASKNAAYIPYAREIINAAIKKYNTNLESQAGFQHAMLSADKFQMATLLPFDANKTIQAMIGGRAVSILAKGIPSTNIDIIEQLQKDLSSATSKAAEKLQMRKIFGRRESPNKPLVFDFDETLIENMSNLMNFPNGGVNNELFNDLPRVEKALESIKLTRLGEVLKAKLDNQELSVDDLRIVSARPQSNAPYMAKALSRLGINIPESKITGTSGPENKINNIGEFETLIDDRLATVEQFKKAGKKAIGYAPIISDFEGVKAVFAGQAAMEGAAAEKILANLGAPLRADAEPGRPIDYPDGLGLSAQYWDLDPNIPTEVKRELNSSAITRTKAEISRFYNKNAEGYKVGGEVKQSDIYLQRYKQLIASILPKEMISDEGLLKTPSGRSESIEILPPEPPRTEYDSWLASIFGADKVEASKRGATYSGGLVYKLIRQNLYDAKDSIPEKEFQALKTFVDQNLLFQGDDDIINLREQKRVGSLAHESFHDIQGYLLDYYPEVYKKLQQSVNDQRKNIEAWYSDPSTAQWRTSRDYKLNNLFPESELDSPYSDVILQESMESAKKITGQKLMSPGFWDKVYPGTMMDLGRAEAIPVLMAAASEGNSSAQQILSNIFGSAGLNRDFYKSMPKFANGGDVQSLSDRRKKLPSVNQVGAEMADQLKLIKGPNAYNQADNNCLEIAMALAKKFGYDADPEKLRSQLKLFQEVRASQNLGYGIQLTPEILKKNSTLRRLANDPTSSRTEASLLIREGDQLMRHVSLEVLGKEYNYGASGKDWPIILRVPVKKKEEMAKDAIKKFAKGGSTQDTVPALLTPGEFVINKKAAQHIGYHKLHQLNKADKIQGFNKGGAVGGIQYFKNGGTPAPGDYEAQVDNFVAQLVKLTQVIEKRTYDLERAGGVSIPEAKKQADTMAQLGVIDAGRATVAINPESAKAVGDAVGRVLESYINKLNPLIEGGKRRTGYEPQGGPSIAGAPPEGFAKFIEDTSPKQNVAEKWKFLAKAAGDSLDVFSNKVKQFTVDLAISYKNLISRTQTQARAAIALSSSQPENEANKATALGLIQSLLENYKPQTLAEQEKFNPAAIERTLNNAAKLMEQGLSFDRIKQSSDLLQIAFDDIIDSSEALNVAISETEKRFGPLGAQQTASETLVRGVESGRWKGSLKQIEALQKSAEDNKSWEFFSGNKFPGFEMVNKRSTETAEMLGKITEKFGGFLGVLGSAATVVGGALPGLFKSFDTLTGSVLATSTVAQGLARSLSEAGANAVGMAKLAKEAGLGIKGTGIATITAAITSGIKGFAEGYSQQRLENTSVKMAQSQENFNNLMSQLSTPGLLPAERQDIQANALREIYAITEQSGSVIENTSTRFSTVLYNLADAVLFATQTFISMAGALHMAGFSDGGSVRYYSGGDSVNRVFKPKGTDTVPAMLTPGEFVVNARSAKKNKNLLEDINSGRYMARGGTVYAAGGKFIKSDKEAGRYTSDTYVGRLSDYYNPFDQDFYKPMANSGEDAFRIWSRVFAVISVVAGVAAGIAAAAGITFGTIGTFFTSTLPTFFTTLFGGIKSYAIGAFGVIKDSVVSAYTAVKGFVGIKTAAAAATSTTAGGAATATEAAGGGGVMSWMIKAFFVKEIVSAFSGITRFFSKSTLDVEQQRNLLMQKQILEQLTQYAKVAEIQTYSLQDLKDILATANQAPDVASRMKIFSQTSPTRRAAERMMLDAGGFDIQQTESVPQFMDRLRQQQPQRVQEASDVIDTARLEFARRLLITTIEKQFAGFGQEKAAQKAKEVVAPLDRLTKYSQLEKLAASGDKKYADLLKKVELLDGTVSGQIQTAETLARISIRLNAEVDLILISLKKFEQGLNYISEGMSNLQGLLPEVVGTRLGGDTPPVKLDRSALVTLKNLTAVSTSEVETAVSTAGRQMGMGQESITYFQDQFKAQQVLETKLPEILSSIIANAPQGGVENDTRTAQLTRELEAELTKVVPERYAKELTRSIVSELDSATTGNRQGGGYESILRDPTKLGAIFKQAQASIGFFTKSLEDSYTALETLTRISDSYSSALIKVTEYQIAAAKASAEGSMNVKKALRLDIPLEEMNQVFTDEIERLTTITMDRPGIGLMQGTTDPTEIARRLGLLEQERANILEELQNIAPPETIQQIQAGNIPADVLKPKVLDLAKRFGIVNAETDRLSKALTTLATSTANVNNIMNKIESQRRVSDSQTANFNDFLKNINSPEWIMEQQRQGLARTAVLGGTATRFDIPRAVQAQERATSQMTEADAAASWKEFYTQLLRQFPELLGVLEQKAAQQMGAGQPAFPGVMDMDERIAKLTETLAQENETIRKANEELAKRAGAEGGPTTAAGAIELKMQEAANLWFTTVQKSATLEEEIIKQKQAAEERSKTEADTRREVTEITTGNINANTIKINDYIDTRNTGRSSSMRGPISGGPAFAKGGIVYVQDGQYIDFKAKGTDTVPAMLTPGEFVVNKESTRKNLPLLQSINKNKGGSVSYFDDGGAVTPIFRRKVFDKNGAAYYENTGTLLDEYLIQPSIRDFGGVNKAKPSWLAYLDNQSATGYQGKSFFNSDLWDTIGMLQKFTENKYGIDKSSFPLLYKLASKFNTQFRYLDRADPQWTLDYKDFTKQMSNSDNLLSLIDPNLDGQAVWTSPNGQEIASNNASTIISNLTKDLESIRDIMLYARGRGSETLNRNSTGTYNETMSERFGIIKKSVDQWLTTRRQINFPDLKETSSQITESIFSNKPTPASEQYVQWLKAYGDARAKSVYDIMEKGSLGLLTYTEAAQSRTRRFSREYTKSDADLIVQNERESINPRIEGINNLIKARMLKIGGIKPVIRDNKLVWKEPIEETQRLYEEAQQDAIKPNRTKLPEFETTDARGLRLSKEESDKWLQLERDLSGIPIESLDIFSQLDTVTDNLKYHKPDQYSSEWMKAIGITADNAFRFINRSKGDFFLSFDEFKQHPQFKSVFSHYFTDDNKLWAFNQLDKDKDNFLDISEFFGFSPLLDQYKDTPGPKIAEAFKTAFPEKERVIPVAAPEDILDKVYQLSDNYQRMKTQLDMSSVTAGTPSDAFNTYNQSLDKLKYLSGIYNSSTGKPWRGLSNDSGLEQEIMSSVQSYKNSLQEKINTSEKDKKGNPTWDPSWDKNFELGFEPTAPELRFPSIWNKKFSLDDPNIYPVANLIDSHSRRNMDLREFEHIFSTMKKYISEVNALGIDIPTDELSLVPPTYQNMGSPSFDTKGASSYNLPIWHWDDVDSIIQDIASVSRNSSMFKDSLLLNFKRKGYIQDKDNTQGLYNSLNSSVQDSWSNNQMDLLSKVQKFLKTNVKQSNRLSAHEKNINPQANFYDQLEDYPLNASLIYGAAYNDHKNKQEARIQQGIDSGEFRRIRDSSGKETVVPTGKSPIYRARGGTVYASSGSMVNFQPKGTDTVPAMLTPGEFVVNKKATQKNLGLLQSMNNGNTKGYSSGGVIYRATGGGIGFHPSSKPILSAIDSLEFTGEIDDQIQKSLLKYFGIEESTTFSLDDPLKPFRDFSSNPNARKLDEYYRRNPREARETQRKSRELGGTSMIRERSKFSTGNFDAADPKSYQEGSPLVSELNKYPNHGDYVVDVAKYQNLEQKLKQIKADTIREKMKILPYDELENIKDNPAYLSYVRGAANHIYEIQTLYLRRYALQREKDERLASMTRSHLSLESEPYMTIKRNYEGKIEDTNREITRLSLSAKDPIEYNTPGKAERGDVVSFFMERAHDLRGTVYPPLDDKLGGSSLSKIYLEAATNEADIDDYYKRRIYPRGSSDWSFTEGRSWMDYFGIPEDLEEAAVLGIGLSTKIIPGILGTIAGGIGFALAPPPLNFVLAAALGSLFSAGGEKINGLIENTFLSDDVRADIQDMINKNPENYKAGQWIGFASELGFGAAYVDKIGQKTRKVVGGTLAMMGDRVGAAKYLSLTPEELQLAHRRLNQMVSESDAAIASSSNASRRTIVHAGAVGEIEKQAQKRMSSGQYATPAEAMRDTIDTTRNIDYLFGPNGDKYRSLPSGNGFQGGMGGFNLGLGSNLDQMVYAQGNWDDAIRKYLEGQYDYAALRESMAKSGFLLSSADTALMESSLIRMMEKVSVEKPEIFRSVLQGLKDNGMLDILASLDDGVDRTWYEVLNRLKASFSKEARFQEFAKTYGINGTRADALTIRGGRGVGVDNLGHEISGTWVPPGTPSISGESIGTFTTKFLEDIRTAKLSDMIKFKGGFEDLTNKALADEAIMAAGESVVHNTEQPQNHYRGGLIYASNGQLINFKPKGTDTVPAMLTPGEFVVNKKATQKNLPLLQNINSGYYNKGGKVRYLANGGTSGDANMPIGNGVSNISIDTSSLDAAFSAFGDHVNNMKQSLDNFSQNISVLSNLGEGARFLSVAAASLRNASDNFGNNIRLFNASLSTLEKSINNIPSTIALQVTGSIPVNVNVEINGGKDLDNTLQPFKDTIYNEITAAIKEATQGNININLSTTKR